MTESASAGARVTISDVARAAAVSTATVSRVLNDKPEVKAEVRDRVLSTIERLGYRPNAVARGLRSRRTRTVAILTGDIEGIFTHFANADELDLSRARLQLERFLEVLRFYERHSLPTPLRHAANSGAILQLPESHLDLVRPGVLSYGVSPALDLPLTLALSPALRWLTTVVYFKVVLAGNPISYGSMWAPRSLTRVVTLPARSVAVICSGKLPRPR